MEYWKDGRGSISARGMDIVSCVYTNGAEKVMQHIFSAQFCWMKI
jgi:hypothetical protein